MGKYNSRGRKGKTSKKTSKKVSVKTPSNASIKSIVKQEVAKTFDKTIEKKEADFLSNGLNYVAQLATNASGHAMHDITPICPSGTANGNRVGSAIKHTGMYLNLQFTQEENCQSAREGKIYILRAKSVPISSVSIGTAMERFFKPNMHLFFNNSPNPKILDTSCQYNFDYRNDFEVLKIKKFKLERDSYSAQATMKNVEIKLKLKDNNEIRYDGNSINITQGQLWMVIMLNSGNANLTPSTLVGTTPEGKLANSGLIYTFYGTNYYTDA